MFESELEKIFIGGLVILWFANGWYLNEKLKEVHTKLDAIINAMDKDMGIS